LEVAIVLANNRVDHTALELEAARDLLVRADDDVEQRRAELRDLERLLAELSNQMDQARTDRRHMQQDRTRLRHEETISEAHNRASIRRNEHLMAYLKKTVMGLSTAHAVCEDLRDQQHFTSKEVHMEKVAIRDANRGASVIERAIDQQADRITNTEVRQIRVDDTIGIFSGDLAEREGQARQIAKDLHNYDLIISDVRHQRDAKAMMIDGIVKENDAVKAELDDTIHTVAVLKAKSQQATIDCINVHFQTRGAQTVVEALEEVVAMTKRLILEGKQTIIGYMAEKQKLGLIIEEAEKDIRCGKGELDQIRTASDLLRRQLLQQDARTREKTVEIETAQQQVQRRMLVYDNQTGELGELNHRLSALVQESQELVKGAEAVAHIKVKIITLETHIRRETGIRGRFEGEFDVLRNIHRWTLMKVVDPDRFIHVQLAQYLRVRMETVKREEHALMNQKAQLTKTVGDRTTRIRNNKIADGSCALKVLTEAIERKDREIRDLQREVDLRRSEISKVEELVNEVKAKLRKSHIAVTTIKRQQGQQFPTVPILHIKTLDRTRLGGGFSLNSDRSQSSQTFLTETMAVVDEDEPKRSRPATSRVSRKPVVLVEQHVATARPASNFARISDPEGLQAIVTSASARREEGSRSARSEPIPYVQESPKSKKKLAKKAKPVVARKEDPVGARPTPRSDDPPSISRTARTPRRTKTDLTPIRPYLGPT
jgi:chromosome segregation ATPase